MSNFGSRSTQRSAISTSSASESAVVSFVDAAIAIALHSTRLARWVAPGAPRSPRHRFRAAAAYIPAVASEAIDRRSFLLADRLGRRRARGRRGARGLRRERRRAPPVPHEVPAGATGAQWARLASSLTGHLVRPGMAAYAT